MTAELRALIVREFAAALAAKWRRQQQERDVQRRRRAGNTPAASDVVSYRMTAIVRAARLPRTLKRRPAAKLVLLALADRAHDDGRNAWPAIGTIAAESELGEHTVRKTLEALKRDGIIHEQAPPRYRRGEGRRARAWMLDLERLAALTPQHSADLKDPTPRSGADLEGTDRPTESATPHNATATPHFLKTTPHFCSLTPRTSADDPVLDPVLLNGPLNEEPAAQNAADAPKTKNQGKATTTMKAEYLDVARLVVSSTWPIRSQDELLEKFKVQCPGEFIETDALNALRRALVECRQTRTAVGA